MTHEEIRKLYGHTAQERLWIEIAAQVSELNENFKAFREEQKQMRQRTIEPAKEYTPSQNTANAESKKSTQRVPIPERLAEK